jgi:acetylornithine deacetylase
MAFVDWFKASSTYDEVECIIAEPTGLSSIELGHRGSSFIKINFSGPSGHGSQLASYKDSALSKATVFLNDIESINTEIADKYTDPILGKPTIVPTSIESGDPNSPNKTADFAKIVLDIRTTPGFQGALHNWLDEKGLKYGFSWSGYLQDIMPAVCKKDNSIIKKLIDANGKDVVVSASPWSTEQGIYQKAGIESVVFGPGEPSQAHHQNEYVYIDQITKYEEILHKLLKT